MKRGKMWWMEWVVLVVKWAIVFHPGTSVGCLLPLYLYPRSVSVIAGVYQFVNAAPADKACCGVCRLMVLQALEDHMISHSKYPIVDTTPCPSPIHCLVVYLSWCTLLVCSEKMPWSMCR